MVFTEIDANDYLRKSPTLVRQLYDELSRSLDRLGDEAVKRLQGGVYYKKQSGQANRKTAWKISVRLGRRLSVSVPYAVILDQGSKPHRIEPKPRPAAAGKRGPVLRFVTNGGVVFARGVNHPGTQATQFVAKERAVINTGLGIGMQAALERALASSELGR